MQVLCCHQLCFTLRPPSSTEKCLCNFHIKIAQSSNFPVIKQLFLQCVSTLDDVFNGVLSRCYVLENLLLLYILLVYHLHVSSLTFRDISFIAHSACTNELVIDDAPCLDGFISFCPLVTCFAEMHI
jgi:hypothetical protein